MTASSDHFARLWDAATGRPSGPALRHGREVEKAIFSPDGRRVLTASLDGTAVLWDAATGQRVGSALPQGAETTDATFSPDGRRVITATVEGLSSIWDVETGRRVGSPLEHRGFGYSARFSPDGRWAITAGLNRTARIWDATDGLPVTPPIRHRDSVFEADFTPDGRRFATACQDGTVRLWDFAPQSGPEEDLESLAILLAGRRLEAKDGVFNLKPGELESLWKRLRKTQTDLFEVPREKVIAWHRRKAEDLAVNGHWQEAHAHSMEWTRLAGNTPSAWRARGTAEAQLDLLPAALASFSEALRLAPDHVETAYRVALLQRLTGDDGAYRQTRARLLDRFARTGNPDRAEWLARLCVLAPAEAGFDPAVTVRLAEVSLAAQPGQPQPLELYAAALNRAGRGADAARTFEQASRAGASGPLSRAFSSRASSKAVSHASWERRAEETVLRLDPSSFSGKAGKVR